MFSEYKRERTLAGGEDQQTVWGGRWTDAISNKLDEREKMEISKGKEWEGEKG